MKKKLVSVAVATWNGSKFLRKQLDSLFNQTYRNLEVVVADDNSEDSTLCILEEYKKKAGLSYVVNSKRLGVVRNFERVLSLCKGDYIAFCDQDDIWFPKKVETLVSEIGDYSLICSDAKLIDENDKVFAESFHRYSNIEVPKDKEYFYHLVFHNFVTGCTALLKKELLDVALPIPDGEKYHDWWFALAASKYGGIKYLRDQLVFYRQHSSNDTGIVKKPSVFEELFGFINRIGKRSGSFKYQYAKLQAERLKAIFHSKFFFSEDRDFIQDAILFYENYLNSRIHFKAYTIGRKYEKYIYPNRKGFLRWKALMGGLIG
jgi:glycosyltransferase involved in cell wall biosynthesis